MDENPPAFRPRWFAFAAVAGVLGICALFLAAAEGLSRSGTQAPYFGRYVHDPQTGWRFAPGTEFTFRTQNIENRIRTNGEGFRDLPAPTGGRKHTMAVFGDSFVSNLAVDAGSVFTSVLNSRLDGPDGWAVSNFGINGYGTVQEYLLYEESVKRHGPFDLTAVLFLAENDFDDNAFPWLFVEGRDRPWLSAAADGTPEIAGLPVSRSLWMELKSSLMFRSELARRLFTRTAADAASAVELTPEVWPYPKGMIGLPGVLRYGVRDPVPPTVLIEKITARFLAQFRDRVKKDGGEFVVILAPSHRDYDLMERQQISRDLRTQLGWELADGEPYARFEKELNGLGVNTLNLYPVFREQPVYEMYNEQELHWTAKGNAVAAQAIEAWLKTP